MKMNMFMKTCLQKFVVPNIGKVHCRGYARWTHRRPMNVLAPEEFEEIDKKYQEPKEIPLKEEIKIKWRHKVAAASANELPEDNDNPLEAETFEKKQRKKSFQNFQKPTPKTTDMLETVIDADGNAIYTKMSNNDSRVGSLLTVLKSKKEKMKKDLILLEGMNLIIDALIAGCNLKYLIFTRKPDLEELKKLLPKSGAQIYKMPYREMQMWSDLTTSPGIMGVFRIPDIDQFEPKNPLPLTIICDNVREPGNLGSILRVAAGVGCTSVILTRGCVNLWDSKVTRTAAGSHFRLQIHHKIDFKEIPKLLGSKNINFYIADNKILSTDDNPPDRDALEVVANIPVIPYFSTQFDKETHNVLVIGGETKGISFDSYKLAKEFNAIRLNIPLSNGVESLNTGTALGIICFEIKKQLSMQKSKVPVETDVSLSLRFL